jgi:hypothetical protein
VKKIDFKVTLENRDAATFPDVAWEPIPVLGQHKRRPDLQKQPTYFLAAPTVNNLWTYEFILVDKHEL